MTWLLDFEGYSMRNAPAIRTSLAVLHTLQVRPAPCAAPCVSCSGVACCGCFCGCLMYGWQHVLVQSL
jgi:hypothetical protein